MSDISVSQDALNNFLAPEGANGSPVDNAPHATISVDQESLNNLLQYSEAVHPTGNDWVDAGIGALRDFGVETGRTVATVADVAAPIPAYDDKTGSFYNASHVRESYDKFVKEHIPEVAYSESTAANVSRDVARFLGGFALGSKLVKGSSVAAGAVGDLIVSKQDDATFSEELVDKLVEEYPSLQGPLTEFLGSSGNGYAEKKFKVALEGMLFGKAAEVVFDVAKGAKARFFDGKVKDAGLDHTQSQATAAAAAPPPPDSVLKDAEELKARIDNADALITAAKDAEDEALLHSTMPPEAYPELLPPKPAGGNGDAAEALQNAPKTPTPEQIQKQQGWNDAGTLRLDEEGRTKIRETLFKQIGPDGVVSSTPVALPTEVLNLSKLTSSDAIVRTLNTLGDVIQDHIKNTPQTFGEVSARSADYLSSMLGTNYREVLGPLTLMAENKQNVGPMAHAAASLLLSLSEEAIKVSHMVSNGVGGESAKLMYMHLTDAMAYTAHSLRGAQNAAAKVLSFSRMNIKNGGMTPDDIMKMIEAHGGEDAIKRMADEMKNGNPTRIDAFLNLIDASKVNNFSKNVVGFWYNSVLSRPITHVVNIMGAVNNTVLRPAEKVIGASIDKAYQKVKGVFNSDAANDSAAEAADRTLKEGLAMYNGIRLAFKDSLEAAAHTFKTEVSPFDTTLADAGQNTKFFQFGDGKILNRGEDGTSALFAKDGMLNLAGTFMRTSSRMLQTEDTFFNIINMRAHVYSTAYVEAERRGLSTVKDIPILGENGQTMMVSKFDQYIQGKLAREMQKITSSTPTAASSYAKDITYTSKLDGEHIPTWSGNNTIAGDLATFVSKHPILQVTLAPFVRTPTNIFRDVMEHTPVLAQIRKKFWADLNAGGERRAMVLGKLATGSMLWSSAMMLASEGKIVGGAPADPALKKSWAADGRLPYSFVTEDANGRKTYTQFSRLDPFASFFGLAADLHEIFLRSEAGTRESLATSVTLALANNFSNKSYLANLVKNLAAFSGQVTREQSVDNARNSIIVSFLPAITQTFNPDTELKEVRTLVDTFMSKIPGLSDRVEPRRDMFGEKQYYPSGWLHREIIPFKSSTETLDPVRKEIVRLATTPQARGFQDVATNLSGINLLEYRKNEQSAYDRLLELHGTVKLGGKTMHDRMAALIKSPTYAKLHDGNELFPESKRMDMLQDIRNTYKDAAVRQLLKEYPQLGADVAKHKLDAVRAKAFGADSLK